MSTLTATPTGAAPGKAALLATGCGTAIASVGAVGVLQIERLLGGVWSAAAVLAAGVCCFGLARACARLTAVLPSGAGLLAFLSRGLGRRAGLVLLAVGVLLAAGPLRGGVLALLGVAACAALLAARRLKVRPAGATTVPDPLRE
jgi:hypothetical protein